MVAIVGNGMEIGYCDGDVADGDDFQFPVLFFVLSMVFFSFALP